MAVLTHLETDTGTNVDISSATAVGAYTANADKLIMVDVSIDAVAGNGDYVMYVTRQIGGSGSAYRILPQTTMAAASGLTAISAQSGWITVRNGDVLTCYVDGLAGDTSTPDWSTRWFESAVTLVTLADDAITAAKFDESTAYPLKSADTGATQVARVGADSDTLETLSDQLDAAATASALSTLDGKIDTIDNFLDTEVAAILEDTGTTIPATLATLATAAALDAVDNYVDTELPAIKAKTDLIPASPAEAGEYTAAIAAVQADLDNPNQYKADVSGLATAAALTTVDNEVGVIDGIVDAIKTKTDNLPANTATTLAAIQLDLDNPAQYKADVSGLATTAHVQEVENKVDAIDVTVNTIPTNPLLDTAYTAPDNTGIAAIQSKTDQLTFTTPNKVDTNVTNLTNLSSAIWANPSRSLTVSSVRPRTLVDGDQYTIYKDTSIAIPFTGLGDISGYTNLWFTIKREQDLESADTQSIVHMDYLTGLLYINKAVATAGHGAIVLDDLALGNIRATITKDGAALLPVYAKEPLRWEVKGIAGAAVDILLQGTCFIQPAVTRKIT